MSCIMEPLAGQRLNGKVVPVHDMRHIWGVEV
jgi:hypothetical protein